MFQASTLLCRVETINIYKILPRVTRSHKHLISLFAHLIYTTALWDNLGYFPSQQMRNRLRVFQNLPKAFPLSNKVQTQASCPQVHKNSPAHTASLSTQRGFYCLFRAVCNLCGKNLTLNWITEIFPTQLLCFCTKWNILQICNSCC